MRKKSHISLAKYLVREQGLLQLHEHKKAFYLGSVMPDLNPKMLREPHEFETTYEPWKELLRQLLEQRPDGEMSDAMFWRRLGVAVHYLADYFTFPHNVTFDGNLKDHCMYESELKYYLRAFVRRPEAGRIFCSAARTAREIVNLEELFAYVERAHRAYLPGAHSVGLDCRKILEVCATVLSAVVALACAEESGAGVRCA